MTYRSPVSDHLFILENIVGFDAVCRTERFGELERETSHAVLSEAGRICDAEIAPLQRPGDLHPARLENGIVRTSPGFGEGYQAWAQAGWVGMSARPQHGGLGLPLTLATAVNDMMAGACLALQLNPLMTQGQIEALERHADPHLQDLYLPKLVSGEWSGTMNLTEAQAGSDVGALRSTAVPNADGSYAISGQKIYISWADNDFTENVCHLVLARLPDGPPGTKGISLFMVPKWLPDDQGRLGVQNSLKVVSLEHKLGLHGSPTAVMQYDAATGWLVGQKHCGMAAMFTMMNNARLGVATQGIGVAEGAFQKAMHYARERHQGRAPSGGPIADHADIRRMLMTMKAEIFAARAIALSCAVAIDMAHATDDPEWSAEAGFLTPIAKAFGTDIGSQVAYDGIQVHGGMGYIEESGAAQFLRDVRVTAIYEGTNGIQAMDLVGRKFSDDGQAAIRLLDRVAISAKAAMSLAPDLAQSVSRAQSDLNAATQHLCAQGIQDRFAGAVPFLRAFARLLGGEAHLNALVATNGQGPRAELARFYITRIMPEYRGLLAHATQGADGLYTMSLDELAA